MCYEIPEVENQAKWCCEEGILSQAVIADVCLTISPALPSEACIRRHAIKGIKRLERSE
jgi:hypothetical protein